jgi:glutamyl/glutaminyl-tRNA synthetase
MRCLFPDQESMISQVVVRVVDKDAERNTPEEFAAIAVSIRALGLQQIDQFQIACSGFSAGPLRQSHRRHKR